MAGGVAVTSVVLKAIVLGKHTFLDITKLLFEDIVAFLRDND